MKNWIIYNGQNYSSWDEIPGDILSHAFKYGDACFETALFKNGEIKLVDYHYRRVVDSCKLLGYQVTSIITPKNLLELLNSLNSKEALKVRLTYFRKGNGIYWSDTLETDYLLEISEIEESFGKIYNLGVCDIPLLSNTLFSSLKTTNCLSYIEASKYKKANNLDEVVLLNSQNEVAETSFCNLFLIKNGVISTPSISSGCVEGTMRAYLLDHFNIIEDTITIENLNQADEIFLSNAVKGIIPAKVSPLQTHEETNRIISQLI